MTTQSVVELNDALDRLADHEFCDESPYESENGFDDAAIISDRELVIEWCRVAMFPLPLAEWCEDEGNVLWWKFPVEEPPYCGTPLDEKWPGYHTHYTMILIPWTPK